MFVLESSGSIYVLCLLKDGKTFYVSIVRALTVKMASVMTQQLTELEEETLTLTKDPESAPVAL